MWEAASQQPGSRAAGRVSLFTGAIGALVRQAVCSASQRSVPPMAGALGFGRTEARMARSGRLSARRVCPSQRDMRGRRSKWTARPFECRREWRRLLGVQHVKHGQVFDLHALCGHVILRDDRTLLLRDASTPLLARSLGFMVSSGGAVSGLDVKMPWVEERIQWFRSLSAGLALGVC